MMGQNLPGKVLIVADDLSGAADCGITFATAGLETVVLLDARAPLPSSAEAVALDLDSRRLPDEPAAALNADAVRRLHAPGVALYKKIDSTLRGNWAAETVAFRHAAVTDRQPPLAVIAPAFPATGRTTRGGRMFVKGIPLEDTEVWRNERLTGPADLIALLRAVGMRVALADITLLRQGPDALAHALTTWIGEGVEAVACDAESDDDLTLVATATAALRHQVFWVGSAGLARHLPAALGLAHASSTPELPPLAPDRPVLTVVGSLSGVARAQARALSAVAGVRALAIDPATLRRGPGTSAWGGAEQDLREALLSGDDVLVTTATGPVTDVREGHALAVSLGRLMSEQGVRIGALIMTGGETARAVLAALGVSAIRLLGEVEPGVPLGVSEGARVLPLITKAGAFGDEDTLVRCRDRLRTAAPTTSLGKQ